MNNSAIFQEPQAHSTWKQPGLQGEQPALWPLLRRFVDSMFAVVYNRFTVLVGFSFCMLWTSSGTSEIQHVNYVWQCLSQRIPFNLLLFYHSPSDMPGPPDETLGDAICCDPNNAAYAEPAGTFSTVKLFSQLSSTGLNTFYDSVCGVRCTVTFDQYLISCMKLRFPCSKHLRGATSQTGSLKLKNTDGNLCATQFSHKRFTSISLGQVFGMRNLSRKMLSLTRQRQRQRCDFQLNHLLKLIVWILFQVKSKCGTHLGTWFQDTVGDRYCIDLVCISGSQKIF